MMMKTTQEINEIINALESMKCEHPFSHGQQEVTEQIPQIIELLEKRIPKKVFKIRNSNKGVKFGSCPSCKKNVMWIDYPYFCGHKDCGQALDWGNKSADRQI